MLVPNRAFSIVKHSAAESSRYALGGIRFERDKDGSPYAIATDGRRLVAVNWQEPPVSLFPPVAGVSLEPVDDFSTVVPVVACKDAPKLVKHPRNNPKPILEHVAIDEHGTNGRVPIHATNLEKEVTLKPDSVEGKFPAWRDVFPRYNHANSHSVRVDPACLAEILQTVREIATTRDCRGVTLTIRDAESPVLVTATHDGANVGGVVMPLTPAGPVGAPLSPAWLPQGVEENPCRYETAKEKAMRVALGRITYAAHKAAEEHSDVPELGYIQEFARLALETK